MLTIYEFMQRREKYRPGQFQLVKPFWVPTRGSRKIVFAVAWKEKAEKREDYPWYIYAMATEVVPFPIRTIKILTQPICQVNYGLSYWDQPRHLYYENWIQDWLQKHPDVLARGVNLAVQSVFTESSSNVYDSPSPREYERFVRNGWRLVLVKRDASGHYPGSRHFNYLADDVVVPTAVVHQPEENRFIVSALSIGVIQQPMDHYTVIQGGDGNNYSIVGLRVEYLKHLGIEL